MSKMNWNRVRWEKVIKERGIDSIFQQQTPNEISNKKRKKKPQEFVRMKSRFNSTCATCTKEIVEGKAIKYFPKLKVATHYNCKNPIV